MRVLSFATQIEPFEQAIKKRLYVCCKYSTSLKFVSRHLSPKSRAFSQPARAQSILYTLFSCLLRLRYYVVSPLHQFDNAMQGNHWSEVKRSKKYVSQHSAHIFCSLRKYVSMILAFFDQPQLSWLKDQQNRGDVFVRRWEQVGLVLKDEVLNQTWMIGHAYSGNFATGSTLDTYSKHLWLERIWSLCKFGHLNLFGSGGTSHKSAHSSHWLQCFWVVSTVPLCFQSWGARLIFWMCLVYVAAWRVLTWVSKVAWDGSQRRKACLARCPKYPTPRSQPWKPVAKAAVGRKHQGFQ